MVASCWLFLHNLQNLQTPTDRLKYKGGVSWGVQTEFLNTIFKNLMFQMVNSYVISVFNYASHHEMKVQLHTFSSWALSSCDLLASYPGHFTTGKYLALPPPTVWKWQGKKRNPYTSQDMHSYFPFHSPVTTLTQLPRLGIKQFVFNPLNAELNPICYLLALLAHHFLHVSRLRVKSLILMLLMSYIYMERLFLMFLDHTQRRTTVGRTPLDE